MWVNISTHTLLAERDYLYQVHCYLMRISTHTLLAERDLTY